MCDIRKYPTVPEEEISFGQIKEVVDGLSSWGVCGLTLSGGEPFLRKDLLEILNYVTRKVNRVAIDTNLTLIDEKIAIELAKLPYRKFHLQVSLDGATAETHDSIRGVKGCFDKIMNNIRLIHRVNRKMNSDICMGISSVLMRENLSEIIDLVNLAKELRMKNVSIMPVMKSNVELRDGNDKQVMNNKELQFLNRVIEELIEFKKKSPLLINPEYALKLYPDFFQGKVISNSVKCYAGLMGPNICPDGEVFICHYLIGNINQNSLKDIWHSMQADKVRKITNNCKFPCLQHYAIRFCEANPFVATYQYLRERLISAKAQLVSPKKDSPAGSRKKTINKCKHKKVKVLISDTTRLYPPLWGGPKRIWNLFSNFTQDLFDFTYVGIDYRLSKGKRYSFNRIRSNFKEILCGFPMYYYPWHMIERAFIRNPSLDLFSYLYMHRDWHFKYILNSQKTDVLVCSHPWSSLSMCKGENQLFVYDAHNCEYALMDQILGSHPLKLFILKEVKKAEADCCKKSDLILVCSEKEKQDFVDIYKIDPRYIHIFPNGSESRLPVSKWEKECAKKELGIGADNKTIIFVGAYYRPNTDAARFIVSTLAPALKESMFLIVGSVANVFKSEEIPSNVSLLGEVPEARLDLALKSADIAINPMFSGSGINIKMLDYMSFGLPIVTTVCGARGIETNGRQPILISATDKFAENIQMLCSEKGLSKQMGEDGRCLVAEHYDWKMLGAGLQQIIMKKLN
jgi:MoaA/NifB/PqqE/SkfB family radical SAM enzyme/glycosyltransferase involved in cell wall biosynthesis